MSLASTQTHSLADTVEHEVGALLSTHTSSTNASPLLGLSSITPLLEQVLITVNDMSVRIDALENTIQDMLHEGIEGPPADSPSVKR